MMPRAFLDMWSSVAPALGNHLWQSTLFALVAGFLTLLLRNNSARVRYGLWLAASLKFLIPFSLLVGFGGHLAGIHTISASRPRLYAVVNEVGQPFTKPAAAAGFGVLTFSPSPIHWLPSVLAAVWICGLTAVVAAWYVRWRTISTVIRGATPLLAGRELRALRRMERSGGLRRPIRMVLSPDSLEPGVFGIARPVLLWPQGISKHLDDAHLEAIVAHEVWHVRRRDNLAAVLHMLVEAIFWFHPLVWWLGARLVDERERACDEQVLALGSQRQIYAESILRTCQFCAGFPLPCVSGVTGADLKHRIAHIMTSRSVQSLDLRRKFLLSGAAAAAIALPLMFGLFGASPVRPDSSTEMPSPSAQALDALPSAVGRPSTSVVLPVANAAPPKKKACSKSKAAIADPLVSSAGSNPGREH